MEKLEMRARARAAARAAGLFELEQRLRSDARGELRARTSSSRRGRPASAPTMPIEEEKARAACAPMGELEYIVQSADARGRARALYVIEPDFAMKAHYERLGFAIEPGCRVLLDAASLRPLAVLRLSGRCVRTVPAAHANAGFNPYFDLPPA